MVNSGWPPVCPSDTLYLSSNEFVAASRASFADPHVHSISSQSTGDALQPCSSCTTQCRYHSSQFHTIMSATGTCRSCRHPFTETLVCKCLNRVLCLPPFQMLLAPDAQRGCLASPHREEVPSTESCAVQPWHSRNTHLNGWAHLKIGATRAARILQRKTSDRASQNTALVRKRKTQKRLF